MHPIPPEIKDYISYDPESGECTWLKSPSNNVKVGDKAGCRCKNGYLRVQVKGTFYLVHRLAWYLHHGEDPVGQLIDHINRNRSDNRIVNLRLVNHQQNHQNTAGLGVSYHKHRNTWVAQIKVDGKQYHLGSYSCPVLAGVDYLAVKQILHPKSCQ